MRVALGLAILLLAVSNLWLAREAFEQFELRKELQLDPLGLRHHPDANAARREEGAAVVVLGDSRARGWARAGLPPGVDAIDRGIGGETSAQTLGRLADHVLELAPRTVLLQVGVNDLVLVGVFPERRDRIIQDCQRNIEGVVRRIREGGATVVLATIFPVGSPPLRYQPFLDSDIPTAIEETNRRLRELAGPGVRVLDSTAILAGPEGALRDEFAKDWLHLNARGYAALNEALTPLITPAPPGTGS